MMLIKIIDFLKNDKPILDEDGIKLYAKIKPLLETKDENEGKIEISFEGITNFTAAFINSSISRLIIDIGFEKVAKNLILKDINDLQLIDTIKDSISIAKKQESKKQQKIKE